MPEYNVYISEIRNHVEAFRADSPEQAAAIAKSMPLNSPRFTSRTIREVVEIKWTPVRVFMDGFEGVFYAYTNGERWNGWATPYFTLEEGLRFAKVINAETELEMGKLTYDNELGFVFTDPQDGEDGPLIFRGTYVEDIEPKLYGIGANFWTWQTVSDESEG